MLLRRQAKEFPLADPKVQMAKRLRGRVITSSPVKVWKAKTKNMEVVERLRNKPTQGGYLSGGRFQELRELKMSKALPGYSGGKVLGRGKAGGGKEEKEVIDEVRRVEKEVTNATLKVDPCESAIFVQQWRR